MVLAVSCVPADAAVSHTRRKQLARAQFETAEKLREALTGRPVAERTRRDYHQAIEAYRKVYRLSPISPKAHEAVTAVAELLLESGRAFKDEKAFREAIGQYEFLRKEYPGSRYRWEALFTVGQIYLDDLNQPEQAKATFEEFLKQYPGHALAKQAKEALEEIANPSRKPEKAEAPQVAKSGKLPLVTGVRHWSTPDYTRVAIDLEQEVKYEAGRIADPDRIFFDLHDTKLASELVGKTFDVEDGLLKKVRVAQYQRGRARVVLEVDGVSEYSAFLLPNPYRLVVDIHGKQPVAKAEAKKPEPAKPTPETKRQKALTAEVAEKPSAESAEKGKDKAAEAAQGTSREPELKATTKPTSEPTVEVVTPRAKKGKGKKDKIIAADPNARTAQPGSNGDRSLIRALGLKIGRIVVDAGHGGHDTGTIGPTGLMEKDLVLDVGLRLRKLLENRMGAEVVLTREDDTFVPLETRTAVANKEEADLFISIHANSSSDPGARGIETYYLNFTSSADALEVAARENSVSDKSIHELQDLVKKITINEKIEESREFAGEVQKALHSGLSVRNRGLRDRGVKKAPFIVLIGANMPSILAEISFLSNPQDERRLSTPEYRQKVAEAIYKGMAKYVGGLSGVKVAQKQAKEAGQ